VIASRRLFSTVTLTALLVVPLIGSVGCADMVTFSKDSRQKGVQQYAEGNYQDAAGAFQNAIRQDPRDFRSHYYLAESYAQQGAYQQAINSYQSSLEVLDLSLIAQSEEGHQFRHQVIDGLAKSVAKAHQRTENPTLPAPGKRPAEDALLRAKVARYGGDPDAAVQIYAEAAALDGRDFYIAKEAGLYLEELGQTQQANQVLRRAYAINSNDEQVAAALRRIGVVPGPSLKDRNALANPAVPKGPIPEVDWSKVVGGNGGGQSAPPQPAAGEPAPAPTSVGTVHD
jgi:tetratricopeptide (TPR) repeat protein